MTDTAAQIATPDKTVTGLGENRDLKVEATAGACVAGENTYR